MPWAAFMPLFQRSMAQRWRVRAGRCSNDRCVSTSLPKLLRIARQWPGPSAVLARGQCGVCLLLGVWVDKRRHGLLVAHRARMSDGGEPLSGI
jgi:hypothetical protein